MHRPRLFQARALSRALALITISSCIAWLLVGCAKEDSTSSGSLQSHAAATQLVGPRAEPGDSHWVDLGRSHAHLPYPLAVGNRWDYHIHATTTITTDAGPQPPVDYDAPWQVLISGTAMVEDRRYFVQLEFDPLLMPGPQAIYYERQDRTGLFERDLAPAPTVARITPSSTGLSPFATRLSADVDRMPAAAAHAAAFRSAALALARRVEWTANPALANGSRREPTGPPPGDIALLRYPLHTGAAWIVRDAPRFGRRVVGREQIEVPAGRYVAWRIALSSELYGPNDRAFIWYGDQGMLRLRYHAESVAVDDSGNIVGTVLVDFDQVLASAQLTPIRSPLPAEEPVTSPAPPGE